MHIYVRFAVKSVPDFQMPNPRNAAEFACIAHGNAGLLPRHERSSLARKTKSNEVDYTHIISNMFAPRLTAVPEGGFLLVDR